MRSMVEGAAGARAPVVLYLVASRSRIDLASSLANLGATWSHVSFASSRGGRRPSRRTRRSPDLACWNPRGSRRSSGPPHHEGTKPRPSERMLTRQNSRQPPERHRPASRPLRRPARALAGDDQPGGAVDPAGPVDAAHQRFAAGAGCGAGGAALGGSWLRRRVSGAGHGDRARRRGGGRGASHRERQAEIRVPAHRGAGDRRNRRESTPCVSRISSRTTRSRSRPCRPARWRR